MEEVIIRDGQMPVQILSILWDLSVLGIGWGPASNNPSVLERLIVVSMRWLDFPCILPSH